MRNVRSLPVARTPSILIPSCVRVHRHLSTFSTCNKWQQNIIGAEHVMYMYALPSILAVKVEGQGQLLPEWISGQMSWSLGLTKMNAEYNIMQWRRQDLLRGGAKIEIMSWALTVDFGTGCSSCSMTNAVGLYWSKELWVVDICIS